MRKKNGFTLVELLVVIVLVISILSISIISSVKISERKKQEAYNEVIKEIETAASQYFSSKEYLFEGIEGDSYGEITLQKLVNEDYLNKVTDPRTSKSMNLCNYVEIKRTSDGIIKSSYKDENNNRKSCPDSNKSIVYQYGGPKIELDVSGTLGKNNWYISKVNVTAKVDDQGNGKIAKFTKRVNDSTDNLEIDKLQDTNSYDNVKANIMYEVLNEYGKIARAETQVNVDTEKPSIVAKTSSEEWSNKSQKYWFQDESDSLSGIDYSSLVVYANREGLSDSEINKDDYKWNGEKYNNSEHNSDNGDMKISKESKVQNTIISEGSRKIRYQICDYAGNCTLSNEAIAKIDKTPPKIVAKTSNDTWSNQKQTYWFESESDGLSGINYDSLVAYANISNLTDNQANNEYKWNDGNEEYPNGYRSDLNTLSKPIKGEKYTINAEGSRRIRYKVCDNAGNCTFSNESIARYDNTPPTIIESGSGHVACKNSKNDTMAHGFSIKYNDNLTNVKISYRYSSCGNALSNSISSTNSEDNNTYIQTDFTGCKGSNSSLIYTLKDAAGNETSIELSDSAYTTQPNSKGNCKYNEWYTKYE